MRRKVLLFCPSLKMLFKYQFTDRVSMLTCTLTVSLFKFNSKFIPSTVCVCRLACGDVEGRLGALFNRVQAIQKKTGQFDVSDSAYDPHHHPHPHPPPPPSPLSPALISAALPLFAAAAAAVRRPVFRDDSGGRGGVAAVQEWSKER